MDNKELIERYPFLLPRYIYTDKVVDNYDYSYTLLDDMPYGWKKTFGEMMCEEIRNELLKFDYLYKYRVVQIKEKFSELRWCDNGTPDGCRVSDIIEKYSTLSGNICQCCGKPDVPMYQDGYWITNVCRDCVKDKERWDKLTEGRKYFQSYGKMSTGIDIVTYRQNGEKKYHVDFDNTPDKIRKNWMLS